MSNARSKLQLLLEAVDELINNTEIGECTCPYCRRLREVRELFKEKKED